MDRLNSLKFWCARIKLTDLALCFNHSVWSRLDLNVRLVSLGLLESFIFQNNLMGMFCESC